MFMATVSGAYPAVVRSAIIVRSSRPVASMSSRIDTLGESSITLRMASIRGADDASEWQSAKYRAASSPRSGGQVACDSVCARRAGSSLVVREPMTFAWASRCRRTGSAS